MSQVLSIPKLQENLICGALGAVILLLYQLQQILPDIRALFGSGEIAAISRRQAGFFWWLLAHIFVSLFGAALVAGLLIRPQESYGAIATGMTWTAVVRNFVNTNDKRSKKS